jgi:hypothetical protein
MTTTNTPHKVAFAFDGQKREKVFTNEEQASIFVKGASSKFGARFAILNMEKSAAAPAIIQQPPTPVTPVTNSEFSDAELCRQLALDEYGCEFADLSATQQKDIITKARGQEATALAERSRRASKKEATFNFFFPGQVLTEFYPEIQHELVAYPNDPHAAENAANPLEAVLDSALDTGALSMVPTKPGGAGVGVGGGKRTMPEGTILKEDQIRGPQFMEEFYANYSQAPALGVIASKVAAADEKNQFSLFLKRVMGEVAATFVTAFKVTNKQPFNMVPGKGEIQLQYIEQNSGLSSFNTVNTGSRVKHMLDELNDSDIAEAINTARASGSVWCDDPSGGFVYEVFVRAEDIDKDSMVMTYSYIIGTKGIE